MRIEARSPKARRKRERAGSFHPADRAAQRSVAGTAVPQEPGAGLRNPTPPPETTHLGQELAGRGRALTRWARSWLDLWPNLRHYSPEAVEGLGRTVSGRPK